MFLPWASFISNIRIHVCPIVQYCPGLSGESYCPGLSGESYCPGLSAARESYCWLSMARATCCLTVILFCLAVDDGAILDVQFSDFSYPPPDGFDCIMFEKSIL